MMAAQHQAIERHKKNMVNIVRDREDWANVIAISHQWICSRNRRYIELFARQCLTPGSSMRRCRKHFTWRIRKKEEDGKGRQKKVENGRPIIGNAKAQLGLNVSQLVKKASSTVKSVSCNGYLVFLIHFLIVDCTAGIISSKRFKCLNGCSMLTNLPHCINLRR